VPTIVGPSTLAVGIAASARFRPVTERLFRGGAHTALRMRSKAAHGRVPALSQVFIFLARDLLRLVAEYPLPALEAMQTFVEAHKRLKLEWIHSAVQSRSLTRRPKKQVVLPPLAALLNHHLEVRSVRWKAIEAGPVNGGRPLVGNLN
jgi:hypothetical protein